MDRDIPAFNQLIINKINEKNLLRHQQRLSEIKAAQRSRVYAGSSLNSRANKKAQMLEEEKKTQIEKSNLLLFNKMRNIMGRPDPRNKPNSSQARKQGRYSMEFTRIQQQNRTMYERIEGQRPTINNKKLQQERQKQLNVLKFLGKYSSHSIQTANPNLRSSYASTRQQQNDPRLKGSINQYNTQAVTTNHQYQDEHFPFDEEVDDEDFERLKKMIQAKQKKNNLSKPPSREREKVQPSQRKIKQLPSIPRSAKDIILFKTNRIISQSLYEIRIVRSHQQYEIRCNISGQPQEGLCLILDEEEGNELLQSNNYDYKSIVESIYIKHGKIQLGNWQKQQQEEESKQMFSQNSNKNVTSFAQSRQSNFAFANSSHISELNEEDSYHIQVRQEKPPIEFKNEHQQQQDRIDSLGDEQRFQQYTAKQVQHINKNVQDLVQKPIKFEEKLHAFQFQSPVFEQYPPSKETAEQSEPIQAHKGSSRIHEKQVGKYEQALDEYID